MKILKVVLGLIGIAGVIAVAVLLGQFALDSRELLGAAQRYTGTRPIQDPFQSTSLIAGVAALTGLLLGVAIGLPMRTPGAIRRDALDDTNARRSTEIGNRAAEHTALPEGPDSPRRPGPAGPAPTQEPRP